jgi:ribokinase
MSRHGQPRVTVVGSANVDLVARCERLPRPGETITGARFEQHPGGKGANQAVAAARLGAAVRFVGCVGADAFADVALAGLREAGVELEVDSAAASTGVALIYVDGGGETEIVVAPGANTEVAPEFPLGEHDAILCQLEIPMETVAAAARRCEGLFVVNAAPARAVPAEVLGRADLVVVNRYELETLGEPPRLVALTLGAEGAVLLEDGEEVARTRPPQVDVVDGTAAGDAFTACLVVSLLERRDRDEALRRACAAGALATTRSGAQPSLPTAVEVDAIVARL